MKWAFNLTLRIRDFLSQESSQVYFCYNLKKKSLKDNAVTMLNKNPKIFIFR